MSFSVQNSGINSAELSRVANTGISESGNKAVGDDEKMLAEADAGLAAVVVGHPQQYCDAGMSVQRIALAEPKSSVQAPGADRLTVTGMEGVQGRLGASQHPTVTGVHDALVEQHVSRAVSDGLRSPILSVDEAFNAELIFEDAMQKGAVEDDKEMGKEMERASQMARNAAEEDRKIGYTQMTAAIAGGALQAATSLGGAVQQMKGLNTKSMSIENEMKPQAELKQFHAEQSLELRGVNKPVLSNDEVSHVTVKRDTGETAHYEIDGGGDRLSSEHEAVLAKDAPARQQRIDMHGLRHEQNLIEANRYQIKGNLIQSGGQIGKNQIDAVSAQQQSEARAEQKTDESTQQILTAASNARHEAAQRCREAAQKAIDAAKSLVANSNAVAAQVTGNLRT